MRNSSLLKWAQNNKTNKQANNKSKDEKGKTFFDLKNNRIEEYYVRNKILLLQLYNIS